MKALNAILFLIGLLLFSFSASAVNASYSVPDFNIFNATMYYPLNQTSGIHAPNNISQATKYNTNGSCRNCGGVGNSWARGLLGNGISLNNTAGNSFSTGYEFFLGDPHSISFWINGSFLSWANGAILVGAYGGPGGTNAFYLMYTDVVTGFHLEVVEGVPEGDIRFQGASGNLSSSGFNHFVIRDFAGANNNMFGELWINGKNMTVSSVTGGSLAGGNNSAGRLIFGKRGENEDSRLAQATIDEVLVFNRVISTGEIRTLYLQNYTVQTSGPEVAADKFNMTVPNPRNNTQYNLLNLSLNTTINASEDFQVRLWVNNTLNQTKAGIFSAGTNIAVAFNLTFPLQSNITRSYFIEVFNANQSENSSTQFFFIDRVFPLFLSSASFNNRQVVYNNRLTGTFTVTDDFLLYGFELYVDNVLIDYRQSINATSYTYSMSYNATNLTVGSHNLSINFSDGHTAKEIPKYDYDKGFLENSLKFKFDKDWIKIRALNGSVFDNFDTTKLKDRYNFIHDRGTFSPTETYLVTSNKKISYLGGHPEYPGWLVINDLKKWVDFKIPTENNGATAEQLNDYSVLVTVTGLKKNNLVLQSIGALNTAQRNFTFYKGNVTTTLINPVLATEQTTFTAVFLINNTEVRDINANLSWNYSLYVPVKINNSIQYNFSLSFFVPSIDTITNIVVAWNYTITGINNTEQNSTAPQIQAVLPISVSNCSVGTTNTSLHLAPKDEETDANLIANNTEVDVTLNIYLNQLNSTKVNRSFEFRNNLNYTICFQPNNVTFLTDAFISYVAPSYSQRNYFLSNSQQVNGTSKVVYLYLINNSKDSDVTIEVTDENDDPVIEFFIKILRYFPGTNTFKTVEVARTNNDGKTVSRLILNDVFYKFIVDNGNVTKFISSTQKILTTSLFLRVQLEDSIIQKLNKIDSLDFSLTYSNTTGTFTYTYNDRENIVRTARLSVISKSPSDTAVCDISNSSSAGSMSCIVNTTNNVLYVATAYIDVGDSGLVPIQSIETNLLREFRNFGQAGILIQMLLLSVMVGVGIWRPSAALVFGLLSAIAGTAMGLTGLGYTFFVGLIGLFMLYLILMRD